MSNNLSWIYLLILQCVLTTSRPMELRQDTTDENSSQAYPYNAQNIPKYESPPNPLDEKVISVRITSSVAIGRSNGKINNVPYSEHRTTRRKQDKVSQSTTASETTITTTIASRNDEDTESFLTDLPPNLVGANIEYIKQLNAKKEIKEQNSEQVHPFQVNLKLEHKEETATGSDFGDNTDVSENDKNIPLARNIPISYYANQLNDWKKIYFSNPDPVYKKQNNETVQTPVTEYILRNTDIENLSLLQNDQTTESIFLEDQTLEIDVSNGNYNETDDSVAESSIQSVKRVSNEDHENGEKVDSVPLARSVSPSSQNYVQGLTTHNKPLRERGNTASLTTVSFNIIHDTPNIQTNYNEPTNTDTPIQTITAQQETYQPKIYSEPSKIYSVPAKFYSEPAKVYSEPAKIYSEPAKIYSVPAKVYSEPAKFYSEPASLHLPPITASQASQHPSQSLPTTTTLATTPPTPVTNPAPLTGKQRIHDYQTEINYEVDENQSVLSNGRTHGVQESTTEKCKQDNCKVGYVVEGRQYKKYRVEERTSDGFIVGEYGVVRNEDGALRGVRYTADSDASPRLIYDALMKFLQLK